MSSDLKRVWDAWPRGCNQYETTEVIVTLIGEPETDRDASPPHIDECRTLTQTSRFPNLYHHSFKVCLQEPHRVSPTAVPISFRLQDLNNCHGSSTSVFAMLIPVVHLLEAIGRFESDDPSFPGDSTMPFDFGGPTSPMAWRPSSEAILSAIAPYTEQGMVNVEPSIVELLAQRIQYLDWVQAQAMAPVPEAVQGMPPSATPMELCESENAVSMDLDLHPIPSPPRQVLPPPSSPIQQPASPVSPAPLSPQQAPPTPPAEGSSAQGDGWGVEDDEAAATRAATGGWGSA